MSCIKANLIISNFSFSRVISIVHIESSSSIKENHQKVFFVQKKNNSTKWQAQSLSWYRLQLCLEWIWLWPVCQLKKRLKQQRKLSMMTIRQEMEHIKNCEKKSFWKIMVLVAKARCNGSFGKLTFFQKKIEEWNKLRCNAQIFKPFAL